ncbi:hypothetical protein ALC62_02724 [Cyphomyrmex costatus]|uniref:Uncharacterized protein n=1 Tax=Cyphomyrmex costatus TaxID=456900 RepID=A0A195D0K4_9HYME|nr:hypothetical protein ALC62_02724 [Cyphomyrmex costatus]
MQRPPSSRLIRDRELIKLAIMALDGADFVDKRTPASSSLLGDPTRIPGVMQFGIQDDGGGRTVRLIKTRNETPGAPRYHRPPHRITLTDQDVRDTGDQVEW